MPDPAILVSGSSAPPRQWLELRAGPLRMRFDPERLALRYIQYGEREVVRSIYGAVRDRNWGTVPPRVSNLRTDLGADRFRLEFDAECRQNEIGFSWKGTLIGESGGTVRCFFDGTAASSFLRNRIGLCVLHPLRECAGQPCWIEHVDGSVQESEFPRLVCPHQPFQHLRAISHQVLPGLKVEVRFEGDTFEMEDQRNWTDASFKTYSTPLALPFPVRVEPGQRVRQEVLVTLRGAVVPVPASSVEFSLLTISTEHSAAMPPIGLCLPEHVPDLSGGKLARLRQLQLSHLRVDLHFVETRWHERLERAAFFARRLGVGLHVALHVSDDAPRELEQLLTLISQIRPPIQLWLVFQAGQPATPTHLVRQATSKLALFDPTIPVAAGTDAYFAEWNRNRPGPTSNALPCFSINPQVHAVDHASLMENLGGQVDTIRTAWEFTRRPVVVSPITLRPRFNPNATAAESQAADQLPSQVDPRQLALAGAVWTLGSIAELTRRGHAHSLTYYETTGWRGVMETETGSPLPHLFPSTPGSVFPIYHVFADLAGFNRRLACETSQPLRVTGLALVNESGRIRVLVGNLRDEPEEVRIRLTARQVRVRALDGNSVGQAVQDPEGFRASPCQLTGVSDGTLNLKLAPLALVCLDEV